MRWDYLAGIIDGEGYIGIIKASPRKKNREINYCYRPRMTIVNTNENLISWLSNNFKGNIQRRKQVHNPTFEFTFSRDETKRLLLKIKNKLIIKKRQAEILLQLFKMKRGVGRGNGYTLIEIEQREKLYQECRLLHRGNSY